MYARRPLRIASNCRLLSFQPPLSVHLSLAGLIPSPPPIPSPAAISHISLRAPLVRSFARSLVRSFAPPLSAWKTALPFTRNGTAVLSGPGLADLDILEIIYDMNILSWALVRNVPGAAPPVRYSSPSPGAARPARNRGDGRTFPAAAPTALQERAAASNRHRSPKARTPAAGASPRQRPSKPCDSECTSGLCKDCAILSRSKRCSALIDRGVSAFAASAHRPSRRRRIRHHRRQGNRGCSVATGGAQRVGAVDRQLSTEAWSGQTCGCR